jgi:hypothetical protein
MLIFASVARRRLRDAPAQLERLKHFWREEGLSDERAIEALAEKLSLDGDIPSMVTN